MKIEIDENDLKELFFLMEEMNDLFHQPMKYEDKEIVSEFAKRNYPAIKKSYYTTLWSILPAELKSEIEES